MCLWMFGCYCHTAERVVAGNQLTFVVLRMLSLLIAAINAGNPRTFFWLADSSWRNQYQEMAHSRNKWVMTTAEWE
jgi:hypothetical protein